MRYEKEANNTAHTIALANCLEGGLSSEKIRWSEAVLQYFPYLVVLVVSLLRDIDGLLVYYVFSALSTDRSFVV